MVTVAMIAGVIVVYLTEDHEHDDEQFSISYCYYLLLNVMIKLIPCYIIITIIRVDSINGIDLLAL